MVEWQRQVVGEIVKKRGDASNEARVRGACGNGMKISRDGGGRCGGVGWEEVGE